MALELSGTEDKTSRSLASILIPMLRLFALGGIFFAPWGGGCTAQLAYFRVSHVEAVKN